MTAETTGPNVRATARLRRGLTVRGLARLCTESGAPVSYSQISRIERGLMAPRPLLRRVLAEQLGLDVTDFDTDQKAAS